MPDAIKGPTGTPPRMDTPTIDPRIIPVKVSVLPFKNPIPFEAKMATIAPLKKQTIPFKLNAFFMFWVN